MATASAAFGNNELASFAVTDFNDSGECHASSDLWFTIWESENFRDVFTKWTDDGSWDAAVDYENQSVDGRNFTDASKNSTCECQSWQSSCGCTGNDDCQSCAPSYAYHYGCDAVDVCFLSTHGGFSAKSASEARVYWIMGDDSNDCAPTSDGNMLWGNSSGGGTGDTEILIVDACHSGQLAVYELSESGNGFLRMVDSTSTLSTYLAYHGTAPDRYAFIDEYAEDAYEDSVGKAWLAHAYASNYLLTGYDACPVAIVFGDNQDDRRHMYRWGGFADREDTGDRSAGVHMWHVDGCDPRKGPAMPTN